jgi:hypothetical protein
MQKVGNLTDLSLDVQVISDSIIYIRSATRRLFELFTEFSGWPAPRFA